jgi:hypothetical protein
VLGSVSAKDVEQDNHTLYKKGDELMILEGISRCSLMHPTEYKIISTEYYSINPPRAPLL